MLLKRALIAVVLVLALPVFIYAQDDTTYVSGQAIIKVAAPFTSVDKTGEVVQTEQEWFNNLAEKYSISDL